MWAYGAVYAVWTQSAFNKGHRLIRLQVVAGLVREGDGAVGEEEHRHPDDCQLTARRSPIARAIILNDSNIIRDLNRPFILGDFFMVSVHM